MKWLAAFFLLPSILFSFSMQAQWSVLTNQYSEVTVSDIHVNGDKIMAVGTLVDPQIQYYKGHIIYSSDFGLDQ